MSRDIGKKLSNFDKSLIERRDIFNDFVRSHPQATIPMITMSLGIRPSLTEFYHYLNSLENNELQILASLKLANPVMNLIMHYDVEEREKVYTRIQEVRDSKCPLYLVRKIAEGDKWKEINELVNYLSEDFLKDRAEYLESRQYIKGTITAKFPGFLRKMKQKCTQKQIYWLLRAIEHDFKREKSIFFSSHVKEKFPDQYSLILQIAIKNGLEDE